MVYPILYSFRRCPYAMRARIAIAASGIPVELREVVLRDKPGELIEASAKATVPVLVLPDGAVIDESLDIMHWALGQSDPQEWLVSVDQRLIEQNDGPFKVALDRYKYPHRYGLESITEHRDCGLTILAKLNGKLQSSTFLTGKSVNITDIAIFPFVRQFAATDQTWFDAQPLSQLHRWLTRLLGLDIFGRIMQRYPKWQAGDVPTIFP